MSAKQQPEILGKEELKTEAKWLKMEKINWKDQDGKEVSYVFHVSRTACAFLAGWCVHVLKADAVLKRVWEAANRTKRPKAGVDCTSIC